MRAVTIRDKQLTVDDHPDPEPGAGEVLVRVRAAGINGADMMRPLSRATRRAEGHPGARAGW
jgi:NADPH:quinone reductase-like Zn-dependent oxidoreductase